MADPAIDLVTLSEAQAALAASGAVAPSDAALGNLITAISAQFQSFINRRLPSQSYNVVLNGHGGDRVSLPNIPITAVASLAVDGRAVAAAANPTAFGYVFSDTQILLRGQCFSRGVQNVALAYTAGFSTIPADIKQAVYEGLAAIINAVAADFGGDPRAIEFKAGDTAIKLASGSVVELSSICLTGNVTSVLNQHRRVHPC